MAHSLIGTNKTCFSIYKGVRKIVKSNYQLRHFYLSVCMPARLSVCPSVRMDELGCHWMDFHKTGYLIIFRKLSRIFKFHSDLK